MNLTIAAAGGAPVEVDRPLVVGRHWECDFVLDDLLVSERHATIEPAPSGLRIADLRSTHATYVNGGRIERPTLLRSGDVIRIGTHELRVHGRSALGDPAGHGIVLTVVAGPDAGTSVAVPAGASIAIGRDDRAELLLTDPAVSGIHCQVSVAAAGDDRFCSGCGLPIGGGDPFCTGCGLALFAAEVKDLGSTNGVLIDHETLPPGRRQAIRPGSHLQIGDTVIAVAGAGDAVRPANLATPTIQRVPARTPQHPLPGTTYVPPAPVRTPGSAGPGFDLAALSSRRAAGIAGGVAVAAIAVIAIVLVVGALRGGERDAAWIRAERGAGTVQVAAYSSGSDAIQTGSGSAIDAGRGLILTNFHVLADDYGNPLADLMTKVRLDGSGDWTEAEVIGYSGCDDLALLRVRSDGIRDDLVSIDLADPSQVSAGMTVVALGFPGTLESLDGAVEQMTVTQGIISKTGVAFAPYRDLIQIDADINRGSSGGPLFNLDGEQVGVNTLGMTDAEGVNYAIGSGRVAEVLPEMTSGMMTPGSDCEVG